MKGLTKEDSARIGFVVDCVFSGALSMAELREWALGVYGEPGEPPLYFLELIEFDQTANHLHRCLGFVPSGPFTERVGRAIWGIAAKRGRLPADCAITREHALEILARHPEVEECYRQEFPFIDLEAEAARNLGVPVTPYLFQDMDLPEGFQFPEAYLRVVSHRPLPELTPWWFYCEFPEHTKDMFETMNVPRTEEHILIPFARYENNSDITTACFDGNDASGNPRIYLYNPWTSSRQIPWADRYFLASFDTWVEEARRDARKYKRSGPGYGP